MQSACRTPYTQMASLLKQENKINVKKKKCKNLKQKKRLLLEVKTRSFMGRLRRQHLSVQSRYYLNSSRYLFVAFSFLTRGIQWAVVAGEERVGEERATNHKDRFRTRFPIRQLKCLKSN